MRRLTWALLTVIAAPMVVCSGGDDEPDEFPTAEPNPQFENQNSRSGDDAYNYLTDDTYSRLYIEIDYMEDDDPSDGVDYGPSQEAIDALLVALGRFCRKDTIIYDGEATDVIPIATAADGSLQENYTYDDVNDLEIEYRDRYHDGDTAVMYFLYVNGRYITDEGDPTTVVGFAHHGSSMAVFKGVVNSIRLEANRAFYEQTVVIHEVGHLLGLVTTGIPAQADHVDNDDNAGRGVHCSNEECLMFWQVNSIQFLETIINGTERDFDQDCQDDMAAAGGLDAGSSGRAGATGSPAHPVNTDPHALDPNHPNVLF